MPNLPRTFSSRDLFLLFVGSVIGSGIFLTPGLILQEVNGSVGISLLVWILAGILSLLGALTFAELAASTPESGGLYCYIRDGLGRFPAFLYGWCVFLIIGSGSAAALTRAFSHYLEEAFPLSPLQSRLCGVGMIAVVTAVNIAGAKKGSALQNWATYIKVFIIVCLSGSLLYWGRHFGELRPAFGFTQHGAVLWSNFGLAMITALWAYEGWQFCTCCAGEVVDPGKSIPRAFFGGSLALIAIFITAVVADLVALGPSVARFSNAITADAAREVFGASAGRLVSITIVIGVFSAVNGIILTTPRIFFKMAQDGLFFRCFAEVHPRFHTPASAIFAVGACSALLASVGTFAQLISGVIFISWIFNGLAAACIFPLRRRVAAGTLSYRVPGYPVTPFLFILAAALLVSNAVWRAIGDPNGFVHIIVAVLILTLGMPIYFIWSKRTVSP